MELSNAPLTQAYNRPDESISFTETYSYDLSAEDQKENEFSWDLGSTRPFDELILSWNGIRPAQGKWVFWVRLRQGEWSPWIRYAEWAPHSQKTFEYMPQGAFIEGYQDAVFPRDGYCDSAQVKVTAEDGASLDSFHALYACLSCLSSYREPASAPVLPSVLLPQVPLCSQFQLDHPRAKDLCSPTSTTTAINYLLGKQKTDPVSFAAKIHDKGFDIYGNWILNTAQGYEELEGKFRCYAKRLPHFAALHSYLMQSLPVVISIRGPLPGSAVPMTFGHLICIIGYDAANQKVLCVDSAFKEQEQTFASYNVRDLLTAWGKRRNIAYIFEPKSLEWILEKLQLPL